MPYMPKDSAAANEQRTAVRITKPSVNSANRTLSYQPAYMAVQEDPGAAASILLLKQKKQMCSRYLGTALVIMAAGTMSILLTTGPDWNFLVLAAVIAAVVPLYSVSGSIRVDGIKINETVYRNLTPEDRDTLFLARDKYLANAVLKLLTERYTEAEERLAEEAKKHREEEIRRNREKALELLNRTGSPGIPDTPTPKEAPDRHDRHL